ncbi:peptide transporter family 2-like [Venturia canescens]|uniref:peptide transporter family 2-like n=1 Tax=Venturia canescens TaxID=32260 RepID=UPI001C9C7C13|nr:peptide transporter family 2-like [Venturia canescens]
MYERPGNEKHLLATPLQPDTTSYPKSIFLIIATEFCERFSFCGLRTILSLYLRNVLLLHENGATVIYHVFIMMCYFVPVAGAILADSYLGRFRTILYFSIIYAIGNVLMCFAATPPIALWPVAMTYVGLTLIAWGTGGIKPCVAAFGGDQFHLPQQQKRLQAFFSIFYFTINFGGLMGMILIPILRKALTCFGDDTCYALGFGFPAALMVTALLLFLLGKPLYRLKYPKENITLNFISCIFYALKQKFACRNWPETGNEHWLDYASDRFPTKLIAEIKIVLAVLFLYIPLPLFWSLFDQQGSRWTFQASRMNGELLGTQILPDQMQVINPAIVLILIPIFDRHIYRWFSGSLNSPLQRMIIGGIFAGLSFIVSGFLELKLEKTYPVLPERGRSSLYVINALGCDVGILASFDPELTLNAGEKEAFNVSSHNNRTVYDIYLVAPSQCWDVELNEPSLMSKVQPIEYQVDTIIVSVVGKSLHLFVTEPNDYAKSLSGRPKLRIIFLRDSTCLNTVTVTLESRNGLENKYFVPDENPLSESTYMEFEPGLYQYVIRYRDARVDERALVTFELGAVYLLVLREHGDKVMFHRLYTMTPPNKIHMLWLIPQYLLISIGEVMFAISGLEFSFTQAPNSMKTVTIAAWYVSVALGNLMVIIITQARIFRSQAHEFFLFAGLILANMLIFALMVGRYDFVVLEADSSLIPEANEAEVNKEKEEDESPLLR